MLMDWLRLRDVPGMVSRSFYCSNFRSSPNDFWSLLLTEFERTVKVPFPEDFKRLILATKSVPYGRKVTDDSSIAIFISSLY